MLNRRRLLPVHLRFPRPAGPGGAPDRDRYPVDPVSTMLRMRYGPTQLWAFYRSPLGVKLYRYVMGSVITTVVSFSVLTLVFGVLHLWGAVACTRSR